ncbi:MAG: DUF1292 domain-containing protein [Lachnospiraceae bacterium]|nr:DUF1292 domain-containing protein [Lachnospiraceae bacterium]
MEKLEFIPEGSDTPATFYVLAQTDIDGKSYLLVSDVDPDGDEDGDVYIMRDDSEAQDEEASFVFVEDDGEYDRAALAFADTIEELDIDVE